MRRILLINNFEVTFKVNFKSFIVVFAIFFLFANNFSLNAQNCSVNAGIFERICENQKLFLYGERTGLWPEGSVTTWQQVAGPSVIIVNPHELTTEVIGISGGNDSIDYRFRISSKCLDGSLVYQDVIKRVYRITPANAGSGFTSCPGLNVGSLSANDPDTNEIGQWLISGDDNAGVTFDDNSDPNSGINLAETSCGSSTLVWQIINNNGCTSQDTIVITNLGGVTDISAGPDQVLSQCYSTTQSTNLEGSFAGCGIDGQQGVWTVISGPNVPLIVDPGSNDSEVKNLIEGTYRFRWTVTGACASGYAEVDIIVPPPTADISRANAGSNQVFCDPRNTTVLSGNAPLYINETVEWELIDGPEGSEEDINIVSPNLPVTQVTGLDGESTYTFRYTITNSETNCSSTETVTVSYLKDPPSLFIIQKPILLPCGITVAEIPFIFEGSGVNQYRVFNGPEGVFTYPTEWTSSGGTSPAIIPNLTEPGEYHIQMRRYTAVNVGCESAFDDVVVTVSIESVEANAGTPQILNCNVTTTTLAGNKAGEQYCHTWSQVDGPSTVTLVDIHAYELDIEDLKPGLYTFRWCISGGPMCETKSSETTVLVSDEKPKAEGAGDPQTVCHGSPVFLNAQPKNFVFEVGTWSVEPSEGVMISDINDPNAVVTELQENTVYLFTWTVTNGCGSATSTVTITVSDELGPGMADAGPDECITVGQTSTTLSANAPQSDETGTWSFISIPDGATTPTLSPDENNHNAVISGLQEGTYMLEWMLTTEEGCTPTRDTILITVADITEAVAGDDIDACSSEFQLQGNEPASGESGLWTQVSGPGGVQIVSPTFSTTDVSVAIDGFYTFRWTIINGACISSDDVKVFVSDNPPSTATITLADDVCGQTTNTLIAEDPTTGSGKWSSVSGPNTPVFSSPNSFQTEVTGLITGEYVVKWTVEGGLFCDPSVATASFTVVEKADAGADQAYCEEITAVNLTGNATSEGEWSVVSMPDGVSTVTITTTSANTAIASGLSPGTDPEKGTYVFRYTISADGCESYDDMEVTLWHPPSVAAAGNDQELCDESAFYLQATPPVDGAGTWTKLFGPESGDFTDANDPETTYIGAEPGVYVFEWTVANGDCSNADQVRIENYAKPSVSVAGEPQNLVCSTETIMAGNDPQIGVGTWTLTAKSETAPEPTIVSPILYNTPVTGLGPQSDGSPGVYTFSWTISNGNVCTPTISYTSLTVYQIPTPAIAGQDQEFCDQTSTTLDATEADVGTGTWTVLSKPPAAGDPVFTPDINTHDAVISDLGYGVYVLEWRTETEFCTSTDTMTITNYEEPSEAEAGEDAEICQFDPLVLNATPPLVGTGEWTLLEGPNTPYIIDTASPTTQVVGTITGTYQFVWTVSNDGCDTKSSTVTITINQEPELAVIEGGDMDLCGVTTVELEGNEPESFATGTWTVVSIDPQGGALPTFTDEHSAITDINGLEPDFPRTYKIRWTVANGICEKFDEIEIRNWEPLTDPDAGEDQVVCDVGTVTLTANTPVVGTGEWQLTAGPNTPTINTPNSYTTTVDGLIPGTYTFSWVISATEEPWVTDENEGPCKSKIDDVRIIIRSPIIITAPDAITVCNGDSPELEVAVSGGSGIYTYTWQQSDDCDDDWNNIPSATGNTYSPGSLNEGVYCYKIVVEAYDPDIEGDNISDCMESIHTITVTVQPTPVALATPTYTLCDGDETEIQLGTNVTGTTPEVTYTWEASSGELTAGEHYTESCNANCGELIQETINNPLAYPVTITYTITPWIGECEGSPVSVTLTVNPSAQVNKPENIVLCHNEPSDGVNFTTDRIDGITTYTWTIDNNDIWDLDIEGNGNIPGFTASNTTTLPITGIVTVTPLYTNNDVTCQGESIVFTITVNPLGQVDKPDNQVVCHDDLTEVNFTSENTGGTTTYEWKHSNPAIGLGESGNGDISFDAINNTTAPVSSTFTVTPTFTYSGKSCTGPSEEFVIWVNPAGQVNEIDHQRLCNGETTDAVTFTTINTGGNTTYSWSIDKNIGSPLNGTGDMSSFTAVNNGNTPVVATITVIPLFENGGISCEGESKEFTITVDPTPVVTSPSSITICSDENVNYQITSNVESTTFTWTAQNTVGTVAGWPVGTVTGTYINDLLTNIDQADGVVIYSIQPIGPDPQTCAGPPFYLEVNIVNCDPVIGVAKQLVNVTKNGDGTHDVKFNIRVQNYGNVQLYDIQVSEDLDNIFGSGNFEVLELYSTSFDVNMAYTGTQPDTLLLDNGGTSNILEPGASTNIVLNLRILSAGEYENSVFARAESIAGTVTDTSQNGSDPDPDGDEDPTNNNDPTPVVLEDCDLSIDCPVGSPYIFNVTPGYCGYLVPDNSLDATAQTNCDLVSLRHDFGACCYHTLEDKLLPVGTTDIIWTATDASGNVKTCTIEITVIDNEPPEFINCPQGNTITVSLFPGVCEGGANWSIPVAVDNCGEVVVTQTKGPAPGSVNAVGEYLIEYTATDGSNNTAVCTFTLKIIDTEGPLIVCPGNIFVETANDGCTWVSPAGSLTPLLANSNCPATVSYEITGATNTSGINDASGVAFDLGISEVTYTITETDSGQTWSCAFTVEVVDTTPPYIACSGFQEVTLDVGTCTTSITLDLPTVTDNCTTSPELFYIIHYAPNDYFEHDFPGTSEPFPSTQLEQTFPYGWNLVEWFAKDESGNIGTCIQNVVVNTPHDPVVYAGGNKFVCETEGSYTITGAIAENVVSFEWFSLGSGTFTNENTLEPTYEFSDADINAGMVIIGLYGRVCDHGDDDLMFLYISKQPTADAGPDAAICPNEDFVLTGATATNYESLSWTTSGDGTFNNENALNPTYTPGSNDIVAGSVILTLTADTESGSTCVPAVSSMTLTFEDNEPPIFVNCPDGQTFTVGLFDGICEGGAIWSIPIAEDNCSVTVTQVEGPVPGEMLYVGVYTITYRAEDAFGNAATCTFYLDVVDTDEPLIVCPDNVVVSTTDIGTCEWTSPAGSLTPLLASSNCPATVSYDITGATTASGFDDASGVVFNIGTSTVTYTITETSSGQSWSCSFTVTVIDEEAPVIDICPEAISQNTDTGECTSTIALILPGVSDNCTATPIISYRVFNPDHSLSQWYGSASNTYTFSLGISQVEWKAEDEYGNTTFCLQEVEITDNELPQIVCASESPFIRTTTEGVCGYLVDGNEFDATASDNCSIVSLSHDYAPYNPATLAGATFPVGTTIVTWTAVDASGNSTSCSITIVVEDKEAPFFVNCPDGEIFTVGLFDGICEGGAIWSIPIAEDNCSVTVTQVEGPAPGTGTLAVGIYTITYRAEDASGNAATCTFYINVIDTDEPLIVCPGNVVVSTTDTETCEWTSPAGSLTPLLASSNCPATVSYVITGATTASGFDDASGVVFNIGTSTVTYTITETASGQSWNCSFTVTVVDEEAPVIDICPEAISQNTDTDECTSTIALILPEVSDNCTATPIISYRVFNPDHSLSPWYGSTSNTYTFSLGISQVEWKAEDEYGNITTCLQEVEITDNELPKIVCASDSPFTRTTTEGVCGYIVDGSEFDAIASDNCSIVSLSHDYAPYNPATLAGATFPVGTTIVTWTAVDASGNSTSCSITIVVEDKEAPFFVNCPDGEIFTVGLFDGICEGGAIWSIPIAEDNCSVTVTQVEGPAPGTGTLAVGIYTITYRAEDAFGNAATCTFYLDVVDTDEPLIVCPDNVVVSTTDIGTCEWTSPAGSLTPLLASSNCPATVSYDITGATTASGFDDASGVVFNIGTSTVTYTITETSSGQSWSCSFTVTVIDEEAPVIDICPEAISQNTDDGECAAIIELDLPEVSDNCTDIPTISYRVFNPDHSLSPWYGSASNIYTFGLGISQVEWKVEDEFGNTTFCLQEVHIIDSIPPQITCASGSPFTRTTTEGVCGYIADGTEFDAIASDNCTLVNLTHNYTPYNPGTLAGATFPVGTTIVTWTAVDASGNTSECQISITVADNEAPVFVNCPDGQTFTVGLFDGICEGGAIWSIPIAEDNCSVTVTQVEGPMPGEMLYVGVYTITYRAEDAFGNAATCTFYLDVVDTDEPLIVCPDNVVVSTTDIGTCEWTSPAGSLTPLLASSNCPATVSYDITGATTASGFDDASGVVFNIGTSTVTYTITETSSGQSWSCSFTVTVIDEEAPVIDICPEAISQNTDDGECAAIIELDLPEVSDNCTDIPTISYRVFNPDHSLSPWYGSASNIYTFGLGISQVEWKVEDEFGNTTFCLQEVQILEVPVTVDAGSDMGICAGQSYQLNGSVTNTMTFEWSTSGTGSFDNPNALNPVYTPSYGDILDVQVTITLTATGPCSTVSDQMVLTIFPPPVANAGIDAVICLGDSYQIVTASADHYTGLSWTHNGLGTLLGSNTLTPVYQSASGETGIVTLELTVEGYGTCGSVTDVMTITIAPSPEADAGVNTDLCGESYALLNGNFVPDAIVEWSQVGGPNQAFLFNANTNNALAFGIINGTYTFSYTVTIGSCVSTDEVVITNWQPPVCCISAGSDLIICDDDEVILTGTLPLVGDLLWSQVNGPSTAVIQTPDNYQTLVTGLVPGVYTFKYANFNGPACDTICDFVSVTVYEPPVAFAGVDTVICQNYSYEINDATASGYNSLEWSTSGTGSFSDVTALNPVYTPSQTDIINGSVQLKLKAYGSVHCPIAISTMILTIQAPADIQAVDDVGTPVNGYTGGIAVLNVLTNDLLNGQAVVDFTNVTLTVIEPASSTGVNLDINTGQVTVDIATNPGIYTIKYRICENLCPDNCSDAIVTITVLVPVPPDSTVVECLSHAIPPVAPEVVDVVCGGLVTSTYVFIDDPDPLVCEGSRVYIYTYEDCAQNRFTWTYTYNVERSTPPVIAAGSAVPTSSVVECYSSVVPPELPVVIDVCDNVLNPVDGSPVISGTYDGCEGTVVYTYTYKDCADLPFVWTYTYTIEHSTGPVMSKPAPVSSIVECYADITEPELPTVVDACGNVLSPTVSSPEVESNYDNCEGTVTYTYTFKDCAGLELAWNYTYTIDLQTAPVVPDNGEATVNCFADASEPILPEVYDHCGNIITAELISVIDDPDMYACEGSRVYTYKYTDCAGNSSDWQLTYYIELTTSPEVPANGNATVNCISDAVPPQIPEITDACGNVLTPELVEIVTEPQDIVCSGTRIYKYEFQDCAGNISYWMFTYTISRYTPPHVQVPAPNKATVTCLEDAVWPTQMPVVVDACGNVLDYTPPVNITTMGYNNGVMCDGGYKRYTFKYKDPCNPSIEMSWVFMYTVLPQTGPELIDQLAGCNILNQDGIQISLAEAQLFDPASLEASVAALYMASCGDVDANLINTTYTGNDLSWTGIYTYKIFDRCDNFQICQVMYSGGFVGGPTLIDPLEDCSSLSQQNINQCFAYVEAFDGTTLESDVASLYTYFGEPVTATLVDSDVSGDDCNWLAIYTFDIKGEVGESVSCQVFYTGGDTEAPVLIGDLPQGKTGMNLCFADIPEGPGADEIKALFTDNCSEVTVVKSGTPTGDNCNWSVTYVYDITDECGNAADQIIITYSGSNQTPPIVPDAINVAVNCKSQVVEPDILPVVTAACGDTLTYSLLSVQEIPPAFTCEGNIIYTYRFTDECGLYSDWTYNYTVERTTPPHQVGGPVPATKTVACLEDAVWPEQLPVVVDACGNILDYTPPVNITTMGYSQGEMCNGGYKRYTFKYKDPCNPAIEMSWVFRYEILPTTTPVLKDELVSCSSLDQTGLTWTLGYAEQFDPAVLEGDVAALYKDVCGDDITATHIRTEKDHQSELGLVTVWNFYYTFKIENSCGNYVECEVHYNGSEVPTTLTLENITVEIDDVMCFGASEVLTVSDVVVKDGGDLTLIAGQSIKLLPGFTVEEGGYLHAYISDTYCANPTPLVVAKDSESTLPETITELIEDNLLFKVYPNPTLDNFTLDMIDYDEAITVEVYDLLGDRIIIKQLSGAKKYEFNLTKQARGVYIIRVFTTEDSGFERIIKQ